MVYSQVCHDRCGIIGIPSGTTGDARIKKCSAMGGSKMTFVRFTGDRSCLKCGCPWYNHIHQRCDTEVRAIQLEDVRVSTEMKQAQGAQEKAEIVKLSLGRELQQLKEAED